MTGLGTLLAQARIEQGFTIDEMSERTRIRPQFLQAIEEEQFHLLPDQAYVKPFIRTYARALGVEDQIEAETEPRETSLLAEDLATSIRERRERARKARRTRFLIRLRLGAVSLAGAAYLVDWFMNS
jgi:cytoskeletal protein RodZ